MLKRLRGTPIVRHDKTWGMVYDAAPPYEIQQTKLIDAAAMARMKRFARFWDLVANSGNFNASVATLLADGSAFERFLLLADWLYARFDRAHGIPLQELAEAVLRFGVDVREFIERDFAETIWRDWVNAGRGDRPVFLRDFVPKDEARQVRRAQVKAIPARQARHLAKQRE
jgi:hypothetical protein